MEPESYMPELPDDIFEVLLTFAGNLSRKFLLALTNKHLLEFVCSKITSLEEPWVAKPITPQVLAEQYEQMKGRARRAPAGYYGILSQLSNVTSLSVHFSSADHWEYYLPLLKSRAPSLRHLKLTSAANPIVSQAIEEGLLRPNSTAFPQFTNLEKLEISVIAPRQGLTPISFHLFPGLQELCVVEDSSSRWRRVKGAENLIPGIVDTCPQLKSLFLDCYAIAVAQLELLKKLPQLANLKIVACEFQSETSAPFLGFLSGAFQSDKNFDDALDCCLTFLAKLTPVGLKININDSCVLRSILRRREDGFRSSLNLYAQHCARSGVPIDQHGYISRAVLRDRIIRQSLANPTTLAMLIEHGLDLGAVAARVSRFPLLYEFFKTNPSVELFQLIFETKLAKDRTMTAFEYAQSLHPDYPFFWATPLFTLLTQSQATFLPRRQHFSERPHNAVQLMKYIVENRSRLAPILGSELALGGPTIPSVRCEYPIHYTNELNTLLFLLEQGADPWVLDSKGQTLLCYSLRSADPRVIHLLLSRPDFNAKFVNNDGLSHLDLVLRNGLRNKDILNALIEAKVIITEHTPESLILFAKQQAPLLSVTKVLPVFNLLSTDQMKDVMKGWLTLDQLPRPALTEHFLTSFGDKINLPALELELLQQGPDSMLGFCCQRENVQAFETLVFRVLDSALSDQILPLWREKLPPLMGAIPTQTKYLLSMLGIKAPPSFQQEVEFASVAARLARKLTPEQLLLNQIEAAPPNREGILLSGRLRIGRRFESFESGDDEDILLAHPPMRRHRRNMPRQQRYLFLNDDGLVNIEHQAAANDAVDEPVASPVMDVLPDLDDDLENVFLPDFSEEPFDELRY